mmetsp:Transcript_6989/g.26109  ORF Transcript_6989/g.26109 Transcript_6989/m.26109 type:complete len:163 (-) Transcript_6989:635-1123(-)
MSLCHQRQMLQASCTHMYTLPNIGKKSPNILKFHTDTVAQIYTILWLESNTLQHMLVKEDNTVFKLFQGTRYPCFFSMIFQADSFEQNQQHMNSTPNVRNQDSLHAKWSFPVRVSSQYGNISQFSSTKSIDMPHTFMHVAWITFQKHNQCSYQENGPRIRRT